MLSIGDHVPIKRNGKTVAGKIIVYPGELEQYLEFIKFEAAAALEKYIGYRKEHGEGATRTSPLFRDAFDPISSGFTKSEKDVKTMTAYAIRQRYNRLLRSIGL